MNEDERGNWYLLTGVVLGIILGILFAWVISPVEYVDTAPESLKDEFKDQYRVLIASAYVANGDLVRAKARLGLLDEADIYLVVAEQAQQMLAEGGSVEEAQALGRLALSLGQEIPQPKITATAE
ncbi:MAG TPA: hypothetical protein VMV80_07930 [Anaerolineales bacterium]|nr:hypothetical protein [Anaerolineales bacterium]